MKKVTILRKRMPFSESYYQSFSYEGSENASVAAMLDELNYKDDLFDAEGNKAPRINWECSCLQGMCGACAMVICGVPRLACETFVRDLPDEILLEPLSKFPVVSDLVLDRSVIQRSLLKGEVFLQEADLPNTEQTDQESFGNQASRGQARRHSKKEEHHAYESAKCLKCGLCLEVCPNYGEGERFYGALFANDCYLIQAKSGGKQKNIQKSFEEHFEKGCSKALSCMTVCPMHIQTIASMSRLIK